MEGQTDLALSDNRGGNVEEEGFALTAGGGKGDGVGAELAVDTAKGGDLPPQVTGVDEGQPDQSLPRRRQWIGPGSANVPRIAQADRSHTVLASLINGQRNRQLGSDLTEPSAPVDDGPCRLGH